MQIFHIRWRFEGTKKVLLTILAVSFCQVFGCDTEKKKVLTYCVCFSFWFQGKFCELALFA